MSRQKQTRINLKRVKEQVIVVTGASSGIGLVTAREAARRGARLVLMARNEDALKKLRNEIHTYGTEAIYEAGDVGNEDDVRRTAEAAIERFGGFDTWVNNAGVGIFGALTEISLADQRRLFDTNFWGVVHGSRVAVGHLRMRGGALVNMGSVTSDRVVPLQGIYSASKHAIKAYTDALRMELEHDGAPVSVTLVKPSSIDTPYCRHAKNHLAFEPCNPPPVYSPAAVADAILHCAAHPRRDVTVGSSGRLIAAASNSAPRATDQAMERTLFEMQMTDRPARENGNGNLYEPAEGLQERGGQERSVMERSIYTRASLDSEMNEGMADLAGTMAGFLASAAQRYGSRPGRSESRL